jgi:hypothetical protein
VTARGIEDIFERTHPAPDYAADDDVLVERSVGGITRVSGVGGARWPDPGVYPRPAVFVSMTFVGPSIEPEWDKAVAEAQEKLDQPPAGTVSPTP